MPRDKVRFYSLPGSCEIAGSAFQETEKELNHCSLFFALCLQGRRDGWSSSTYSGPVCLRACNARTTLVGVTKLALGC